MTHMKISTTQFFNSNATAMSDGQFSISEIQAKLGTGKQLTAPSQDAQKTNLIARLQSSLQRQDVYRENIDFAKTRLNSEETALTSITQVLQRASELAIQSANGTMVAQDRAVLAAEVTELRKELVRLANSRDLEGNYIFAGNRIDSPPFAQDDQGNVEYYGDYGRLMISVSDSRSVAVNTLGNELLTTDDFEAVKLLEDGLLTNDVAALQQSVDELKMSSDRVSVTFGKMAGRISTLNAQSELLEDTALRLETILSQTGDLDYAKAITQLSKESLALQALQASFTKISQLSLFDFMR